MKFSDRLYIFIGLEPSINLNTTRYEYSEFFMLKNDIEKILNEYGQRGWRVIYISESDRSIREFSVLMEREII